MFQNHLAMSLDNRMVDDGVDAVPHLLYSLVNG
jgi:hypothetical protein